MRYEDGRKRSVRRLSFAPFHQLGSHVFVTFRKTKSPHLRASPCIFWLLVIVEAENWSVTVALRADGERILRCAPVGSDSENLATSTSNWSK